MARSFLAKLTLEDGRVVGGLFTPLEADDLPRVLPDPSGGKAAPYVTVDQYGRVITLSDSTAAFTDAANTFTRGQTILWGSGAGLTIQPTAGGLFSLLLKDTSGITRVSVEGDSGNTLFSGLISTATGIRATAFGVYMGVLSADRFEFQNGRIDTFITSSTGFQVRQSDAATTTASDSLVLRHNTSGTPAAGYGATLRLQLQSSTTADQNAAAVTATWTDATHATRTGRLSLGTYYTSTFQEGVRVDAASASINVLVTLAGIVTVRGDGRLQTVVTGDVAAIDVQAAVGNTSPIITVRDPNTGSAVAGFDVTGAILPPELADADAPVSSIYYSTTASKLAFKDSGGTVHALY